MSIVFEVNLVLQFPTLSFTHWLIVHCRFPHHCVSRTYLPHRLSAFAAETAGAGLEASDAPGLVGGGLTSRLIG